MKTNLFTYTKSINFLPLFLFITIATNIYGREKQVLLEAKFPYTSSKSTEENDTQTKRNKETNISKLRRFTKKAKKTTEITAKFCLYGSLGVLAGCNGILTGVILYSFWKNLRQIQQSTISNSAFKTTEFLFKHFTNTPNIKKCIIPVSKITLATSSACSFWVSYNMFNKAYQEIKRNKPKIKLDKMRHQIC